MLQVENRTPFEAALLGMPDPGGVDTVYVTVKATFALDGDRVRVAAAQAPIVPADVYWGDPAASSVRYAGEAHPSKRATDVVVVGAAHAPGGKPSPQFGVSLKVGALHRIVHVFGDRTWKGGIVSATPSHPVPAVTVPLRWERAYGGREVLADGTVLCEPRNPVGCGFRGRKAAVDLDGSPVPNLEVPREPIRTSHDAPPPAGMGFVAPSWEPRARHAGTYDEAWQRRRAPFLPADFDARFLQAAPPEQIYPGRLRGGEPVELLNLAPRGVQRFALPVCDLAARAHVDRRIVTPALECETLLLEPDEDRFSLLWRGAVPCDKRALKVHLVELELRNLQGVAA